MLDTERVCSSFTSSGVESERRVTFRLELDDVASGWFVAANAPDAVSFTLSGESQQVSTYERLYPFLQLYEALRLGESVTNIQFVVVELDHGIHIVYTRNIWNPMAAYSTTYEVGLREVSVFLREVFRQLETAGEDVERTDVTPWLDSFLHELSLEEIHAEVTDQ